MTKNNILKYYYHNNDTNLWIRSIGQFVVSLIFCLPGPNKIYYQYARSLNAGVPMETMFFPQSVAIVGVSNSPSNNGRVIVENMDRFNYRGTIYLVGSKGGLLGEREIYSDVDEIPAVPDLAVILVPARGLLEVLEACGQKGTRRIVIETGGFSEFGEDRRGLEKEILETAARWGMKIIGPNCVGIINVENGLALPFYPLYRHEVKKGPVSVISQSGGLIHDILILSNIENVGLNKLVSIGNKLANDENDILEYLIADPGTKIIGLYLENISDGRRFMELAESTSKPIILLKANRSPGSTEIARFHTSALAGDDRVVNQATKQAGVHRVWNLRGMVDAFKAFSIPPPKGPRLAVIARSGGHAVISADSVFLHGFSLASYSDRFFAMLSEKTRAGVIKRTNPLDLGDVFDFNIYLEITEKAMQEEGVDGVLFLHSYALGVDFEPSIKLISGCGELSRKYGKPVMFCTIAHKEHWLSIREVAHIPVFTHVDDALASFRMSMEHYERKTRMQENRALTVKPTDKKAMSYRLPSGIMPAGDVFDLLKSYGLAVAEFRIVKEVREGSKAAGDMGFPVALKSASPDLLHKTEKGGVILAITDESSLQKAFDVVKADSYVVQRMVPSGCEMIVGGRNEPGFGPCVLCGIGGVLVEVYNDVALRVAPVDQETARHMIEELKGVNILRGFRGRRPYDVESLVQVLVDVSRLMMDHPEISDLDINPLILHDDGTGGRVVDAKIRVW
jgi:acetate---CoA ligase (ADP-forming)